MVVGGDLPISQPMHQLVLDTLLRNETDQSVGRSVGVAKLVGHRISWPIGSWIDLDEHLVGSRLSLSLD